MEEHEADLGDNNALVERMLLAIYEFTGAGEEGESFKNETFEMHTWVMDAECNCDFMRKRSKRRRLHTHSSDCQMRPNFRCGDIEIRWYRHIGRSLEVNRTTSREELETMFKKCLKSIL